MQHHEKIAYITKKGFKVYPKIKLIDRVNLFAVCVEDSKGLVYNENIKTGEYKHGNKTLQTAIEKTVEHIYDKLMEKYGKEKIID